MAATKHKRTIIVERRQRTVMRRNSPEIQTIRCEFCAAEVESLSPEIAAAVFGIKRREIYRRIENGSLHFIEEGDDSLLICVNSLKNL